MARGGIREHDCESVEASGTLDRTAKAFRVTSVNQLSWEGAAKDCVGMLKGGGSLLLANQGPLFGPGRAGILTDGRKTWFTSDFEGDPRMGGRQPWPLCRLPGNRAGPR